VIAISGLPEWVFGQKNRLFGHHFHITQPVSETSLMASSPPKKAADLLPSLLDARDAKEPRKRGLTRALTEGTGVSRWALYKAYERSPERKTRGNLSNKLSIKEEKAVVALCLAFSFSSQSLTMKALVEIVNSFYNRNVHTDWASAFLKRHADALTTAKGKVISSKRCAPDVTIQVHLFIEAMTVFKTHHYVAAHTIINYDETRVTVLDNGILRIDAVGRRQKNQIGTKGITVCTLIPFVSADGRHIATFYVFKKSARGNVVFLSEDRSPVKRFFLFTDSGSIVKSTFVEIVHKFCVLWQEEHPGLECVVVGDQVSSHQDPTVIEYAFQRKIMMLLLPANTSHFTQPLDNIVFAVLKQHFKRKAALASFESQFEIESNQELLFDALYHAEARALTPTSIRRAFQECGIFPFRPDIIQARALANSGNPTFVDDQVVNEAAAMAAEIVKTSKEHASSVKKRLRRFAVDANGKAIFTPEELMAEGERKEAEKKAKAEQKELVKAEKEKAKLVSNEKKKALQEARELKRCLGNECERVHRGGHGWTICKSCETRYCNKHSSMFKEHQCPDENDDNNE
jgi:hypothetical protein